MLRYFPFLIFFYFSSILIFAQNDSLHLKEKNSIKIDSIEIKGNDITDDDIILRELTFKKGDFVSSSLLDYNKERIYSLGIFNRVNLVVKENNAENILVIKVEESWYIYPIPFAQIKERDWKKFSYGIDLIVRNFRGRNELLRVRGSLGYDPSILLNYYNPNLNAKDNIFFNSYLSYSNINNKSNIAENLYGKEFSQKFFDAQIGVGKRLGIYNKLSLNIGYNYVETPFFIKGISASNERIDRVPFVNFIYTLDTRDLAQFPKKGIFGSADIKFKGLGVNGIRYAVMNFDYREYTGILNNLFLKWRLTTRLTAGELIPFYDFSILGYNERVRGHFDDVIEGNNYYLGSVEFYSAILKDTHLTLDFIPILPKELLSYRIAIYTEIFADAGTAKLRGETLRLSDFQSGYGIGLTLLVLPYNSFRVEFALDEYHHSQWIFDLGIAF